MDSFADHMFTPNVRAEQDKIGVGERFEKVYQNRLRGELDADSREFIETRDTFYLATVTESGWPYVQHRGGPEGFLKVLGPETIGFADYTGNKQFISKGNLKNSSKVSIIMMDYPQRARLKLIGYAVVVEAGDDPELLAQLHQENAPAPERLVTIELAAIDWNCPKYITQRFKKEEIDAMIGPHVHSLTERIGELESRLDKVDPSWRNE